MSRSPFFCFCRKLVLRVAVLFYSTIVGQCKRTICKYLAMKKTRRKIDVALPGACEPDLCVEEAASGSSGSGVRRGRWSGWRGGPRTGDREAPRQDRTIDGRARFLSQEARKMRAPDRRGGLQRDHEGPAIRRQCQLRSVVGASGY